MTQQRAMFVVEGPHDEAFVGAILRRRFGLRTIRLHSELDLFWDRLVPKAFPHGGDLRKRVPAPYFYASDAHSVAIVSAEGDTNIVNAVLDNLSVLPRSPEGIGVILDADSEDAPQERFSTVRKGMAAGAVQAGDHPGLVNSSAQPRCGIFVLPDNQSRGTLEDLLLTCGAHVYPAATASARAYVSGISPHEFAKGELKELKKPSGERKAVVAAVATVLRPGKSIQVSIADNRWISDETAGLQGVAAVIDFVREVLALE